MRRRRQKSTLLPKMIGVAVLVNAVLLPILAQFGVFKSIKGSHLTPVRLVDLPKTPPKPPQKARKQPPKQHPQETAHRTHSSTPVKASPFVPKTVTASAGPGPGSDAGPVVQPGTGAAGVVPTGPQNPTPSPAPPAPTPTPAPPKPTPQPMPAPTPVTPAPQPTPPPAPAPVVPKPPPPPAPAPPHVPVVVAAEPLNRPEPQIPDDLQDQDTDTRLAAVFQIAADGSASVRLTQSTGNRRLDQLALDAARRWTFRPATVDGKPIASYLRLEIQFTVS